MRGICMGYYVKVEPNVKLYVEDLNPEGKKNNSIFTWVARKP